VLVDQTNSTAVLTNVAPSDTAYTVSVEVYGQCGSVTNAAALMVYPDTVVNGSVTYGSYGDIVINDNAPATPYPSQIYIPCSPGVPIKATVTLNGVTHEYPSDIMIELVSPNGTAVPIMTHCGGADPITFCKLTFDDGASDKLPQDNQIEPGTYQVSSYIASPQFPSPAPLPNAITMSAFAGQSPGGYWSLYVLDDDALDDGFLKGGWALTLYYGDNTTPYFTNTVYSAGNFQTTLVGSPGFTHYIQASTDLTNWTNVVTTQLPSGSYPFSTNVPAIGPKIFYRAFRP
jgi:subtilisin-like proprotein convertase family protein